MLLGTLDASLMANILSGKWVIAKRHGRRVGVAWVDNGVVQTSNGVTRGGDRIIKAGKDFWFRRFLWIILKFKDITKMDLN